MIKKTMRKVVAVGEAAVGLEVSIAVLRISTSISVMDGVSSKLTPHRAQCSISSKKWRYPHLGGRRHESR